MDKCACKYICFQSQCYTKINKRSIMVDTELLTDAVASESLKI